MPDKRRLLAVAVAVVCSTMLAPRTVLSQQDAMARQPELCELKIQGHSIVSLTLIGKSEALGPEASGLRGQKYMRPGPSLRLPAGQYRVESVELEGSYVSSGSYASGEQWFELALDKSHELVIGAPLSPNVLVKRHGKFLEMDYELVDAAGRQYEFMSRGGQRPDPPTFTVYKDDRLLGSDSFDYG